MLCAHLGDRVARCCAQVSVRRGTARSWDHAQLVHAQLFFAVAKKMDLFVVRVATELNVADLPSRQVSRFPRARGLRCQGAQDFALLKRMGAVEVEPVLTPLFKDAETWAVLQERWRLV